MHGTGRNAGPFAGVVPSGGVGAVTSDRQRSHPGPRGAGRQAVQRSANSASVSLDEAVEQLCSVKERRKFATLEPPDEPGVYAWWVGRAACRDLGQRYVAGRPLYVGMAANLRKRLSQHTSARRQSVGAFLKHALAAQGVIPDSRRVGELAAHAEGALRHWMSRHVRVSWLETENEAEAVRPEGLAIARLEPPFNARGADRRGGDPAWMDRYLSANGAARFDRASRLLIVHEWVLDHDEVLARLPRTAAVEFFFRPDGEVSRFRRVSADEPVREGRIRIEGSWFARLDRAALESRPPDWSAWETRFGALPAWKELVSECNAARKRAYVVASHLHGLL